MTGSKVHISSSDRNEAKIGLTFDDGPNPFYTRKVLEILKEKNVTATFFLIGKWVEKYPDIVNDIVKSGHTVGNHSYSHEKGDFELADSQFTKVIKYSPLYFRLPHINFSFLDDASLEYKQAKKNITMEVDSWDFTNISSDSIYRNVIDNTRNGSLVAFHDGSENPHELESRPSEMVKILPKIIDTLMLRFTLDKLDNLHLTETTTPFITNKSY